MLPRLCVNSLVNDVILTQVLTSNSAAAGVKPSLPSATSKSRLQHFLWHDYLKALAFSSIAGQSSVSQSEFDRAIHKLMK